MSLNLIFLIVMQSFNDIRSAGLEKMTTEVAIFEKDYVTVCGTLAPRLVEKARLQN